MSDLAEQILAAVEMRSQLADEHHLGRCAVFRDFPYAEPCDCTGPREVRNDCAADREIVGLHVVKYDFYCSECGTPDEYPVRWPCPTLRILARGYGIQP